MPRSGAICFWRSFLLCLLLWGTLFAGITQADAEEDRVVGLKTAFLFNFTKFIDWPGAKWDQWRTVHFCFVGVQQFSPLIDKSLSGKTIRGKSITSAHLAPEEDFQSCAVVFIGGITQALSHSTLSGLLAQGSLVVGEHDRFLESGGVINLYIEDNKLRFQINLQAARFAGLVISSKLLGLAQIVNYPVPGER